MKGRSGSGGFTVTTLNPAPLIWPSHRRAAQAHGDGEQREEKHLQRARGVVPLW
ncbi:hypothetical protein [Paracoccus laeviglucosivorans]|uniref:Uncharacterized protein n=1 Tax=Paracoccus laeviglucosivorans TaxID=1197861 RepID=A0A521D0V9_9RHOB|nr:hypothetical protein [Paracoccus laeviglucosivorans]SMO64530.1 hypothetical protein SAMN06265221_105308 [Paracoccus laeviglucosivorans]